MTATVENPAAAGGDATSAGTGRVVRVIGPLVDVEFPAAEIPGIYNALQVDVTLDDEVRTLTLEVAQDIGDNIIRTISMQPTDGRLDLGAGGGYHQGSCLQRPRRDARRAHRVAEDHRALGDSPGPAAVRPAGGKDGDPGDRDQGA